MPMSFSQFPFDFKLYELYFPPLMCKEQNNILIELNWTEFIC